MTVARSERDRLVTLDAAWVRAQVREGLRTYFAPIIGAAKAVAAASRPSPIEPAEVEPQRAVTTPAPLA